MKFKILRKNKEKSKSIKTQLILIIACFVALGCALLGSITSYLNYKTANSILSKTVVETTKQVSQNISQKIESLENAVIQIGMIKELSDPKISIEEKQNILIKQEQLYGLSSGKILDVNGNDIVNGKNVTDREYFKIAMSGKAYISSPIKSKTTGKMVFVVSAPIWENGEKGSNVVGVVTFNPDKEFLNKIVSNIKVSENSYAYLVNKEGTVIGHKDSSHVGVSNSIKDSQSDKSLIPFANADRKLISGQTGYEDAKFNGKAWMVGYAPIENSDGWGIGVMTNKDDFLGGLRTSIITTVILASSFTILGIIVAVHVSKKIGDPLKQCSERLDKLAQGDLHSETIVLDEDNEIGQVSYATSKIVDDISQMINELIHILTQMAEGNLNIDVDEERLTNLFVNDFEPILIALNKIIGNLNNTLSQINISSEQIASGSEQVAEGAQLLSQGATEQASAVEELSSTINEVSDQINQTAQNTIKAQQIALQSSVATDKGKSQMNDMIHAMDEISKTSNEIGNIIKNIDDIAFQTNILALNAAVEAARAGNAGKGFAVVADEVRNLAQKSAQSAKDTETLIHKSILAIENGTQIVSETAKALDEIINGAKDTAQIIQEISDATNEQANHINQVNVGVEQISSVVQNNSATSEESAAASEELSSQSQMLKELVEQFNLKK
ncbi:methyl-accepting chemotaxis protein [Romboutsia lituseburensis]|uniref:methyl-accepting chemotaxis protein n=1 Tax=Romboutsia lituseburensis TaxID=1537 RepID=UPI00215B3AA7|nr:methyl-accepting chemotaxis protein [Romboutsia lituseburensis]MCR8746808.1 methyl-accepting chemotaxis protein [Romboutsia lituseburensis]